MIRMVEDVGAPVAVAAIDLIMEEVAPDYNQYASYALTAIGYIGGYLSKGGGFVKQLGVASLPLTARAIRDLVKGGTTKVGGRLTFRPIRNPIRQTAFDEFADVRVS